MARPQSRPRPATLQPPLSPASQLLPEDKPREMKRRTTPIKIASQNPKKPQMRRRKIMKVPNSRRKFQKIQSQSLLTSPWVKAKLRPISTQPTLAQTNRRFSWAWISVWSSKEATTASASPSNLPKTLWSWLPREALWLFYQIVWCQRELWAKAKVTEKLIDQMKKMMQLIKFWIIKKSMTTSKVKDQKIAQLSLAWREPERAEIKFTNCKTSTKTPKASPQSNSWKTSPKTVA